MELNNVLVKPLLTEKTSIETEKNNRYGFIVNTKASKGQIKVAVEKYFDVKVMNVKTSILPGKLRRSGRNISKTSKQKKAYITIAEGQKIEFFKDI